jgi:hypothetical protein
MRAQVGVRAQERNVRWNWGTSSPQGSAQPSNLSKEGQQEQAMSIAVGLPLNFGFWATSGYDVAGRR